RRDQPADRCRPRELPCRRETRAAGDIKRDRLALPQFQAAGVDLACGGRDPLNGRAGGRHQSTARRKQRRGIDRPNAARALVDRETLVPCARDRISAPAWGRTPLVAPQVLTAKIGRMSLSNHQLSRDYKNGIGFWSSNI